MAAPAVTASSVGGAAPAAIRTSQAASEAAMTAMPPPRGVGIACDERSFGRSSTDARRSSGISARVPRQAAMPAPITTIVGKAALTSAASSAVRTSSRRRPGSMLRAA